MPYKVIGEYMVFGDMPPSMMLTKDFSVGNLTVTNTGLDNTPDQSVKNNLKNMAIALQKIKDELGPFRIASAYRNEQVNTAVGGSPTSRHKYGEAADIVPRLQMAEKYWALILAKPHLKKLFGEISLKKHQGSIHLSLPYRNSAGILIKGSPRVADEDMFGNITYRSQSPEEIKEYIKKHTDGGIAIAGLGPGILILGAGLLSTALVLRFKK